MPQFEQQEKALKKISEEMARANALFDKLNILQNINHAFRLIVDYSLFENTEINEDIGKFSEALDKYEQQLLESYQALSDEKTYHALQIQQQNLLETCKILFRLLPDTIPIREPNDEKAKDEYIKKGMDPNDEKAKAEYAKKAKAEYVRRIKKYGDGVIENDTDGVIENDIIFKDKLFKGIFHIGKKLSANDRMLLQEFNLPINTKAKDNADQILNARKLINAFPGFKLVLMSNDVNQVEANTLYVKQLNDGLQYIYLDSRGVPKTEIFKKTNQRTPDKREQIQPKVSGQPQQIQPIKPSQQHQPIKSGQPQQIQPLKPSQQPQQIKNDDQKRGDLMARLEKSLPPNLFEKTKLHIKLEDILGSFDIIKEKPVTQFILNINMETTRKDLNDQIDAAKKTIDTMRNEKPAPSSSDELEILRNNIKAAVNNYLLTTLTESNIKKSKRGASDRRLNDIKNIHSHLANAQDTQDVIKNVGFVLDTMGVGTFRGGLFGSKLYNNVKKVIDEHKKALDEHNKKYPNLTGHKPKR